MAAYGFAMASFAMAGTFVGMTFSNVPSILTDLRDDIDRGDAIAVFAAAAWIGPTIEPIKSGFHEI